MFVLCSQDIPYNSFFNRAEHNILEFKNIIVIYSNIKLSYLITKDKIYILIGKAFLDGFEIELNIENIYNIEDLLDKSLGKFCLFVINHKL